MKIFGFHLMTDALFRAEKRKAERLGHKVAFADFKDADKVIHGTHLVFMDKQVHEKLVLLGDNMLISNNIFTGSDTMLEIH